MLLKLLFYITVLLLAILGYRSYVLRANTLKVGDHAPDFTLNDANGSAHSLTDYAGKYLILYFYPKDNTSVCVKEACHFRDDLAKMNELGANVVGISTDTSASHDNFTKKYQLNFPLLADNDGKVAAKYDALTNLLITKVAKRHTFLIDPSAKIVHIDKNVNVSTQSQQLIDVLKKIKNQQ